MNLWILKGTGRILYSLPVRILLHLPAGRQGIIHNRTRGIINLPYEAKVLTECRIIDNHKNILTNSPCKLPGFQIFEIVYSCHNIIVFITFSIIKDVRQLFEIVRNCSKRFDVVREEVRILKLSNLRTFSNSSNYSISTSASCARFKLLEIIIVSPGSRVASSAAATAYWFSFSSSTST